MIARHLETLASTVGAMNHWFKFLRLASCERRLLLKAALLVETIRLALWVLPFRNVRGALALATRALPLLPSHDRLSPARIAWAVEAASSYLPAGTCLAQALTALVLLERRGYPAQLRIGVIRNSGGPLRAHAWVESQGATVVGGGALSSYVPCRLWREVLHMAKRDEFPAEAEVSRLRASEHAVAQRYGDEMLLIHLKTDRIVSLNRTGARLWELICAGCDRAEIHRRLLQEFEVSEAELAGAIEDLLGSLRDEGLIGPEDAS